MAKRREKGTGSVSQRKDGVWTARTEICKDENGKRIVKAVYGKSEQEVRKKLKNYKKETLANTPDSVAKNTVRDFMINWLENIKINDLKPKSYDRLEQTVYNQIIPAIGNLQVASVSCDDVQDLINGLKAEGLAYSTIKKTYDAINECYRTGIIKKKIVSNPAIGVTLPKKSSFDSRELRYYTKEEAQKLCEVALSSYGNGKRVYRIGEAIVIDLNTGLRLGELAALKWEDVDLDKRVIHVKGTNILVKDRINGGYHEVNQKSAKSATSIRSVDINDAAMSAFKTVKELTGDSPYVFCNSNGKPTSMRYLDRLLRKIAVAANFPEDKIFGMHSLRHTFASSLFQSGTDVKVVSEILGHSDINITYNIYIHLIGEQKKKAIQRISNMYL